MFFNKTIFVSHRFFLSPEIIPLLTLDYCKLNIIRVQEMRASLSRIVLAADQYLAYSCNKQTEVNKAKSQKLVATK